MSGLKSVIILATFAIMSTMVAFVCFEYRGLPDGTRVKRETRVVRDGTWVYRPHCRYKLPGKIQYWISR